MTTIEKPPVATGNDPDESGKAGFFTSILVGILYIAAGLAGASALKFFAWLAETYVDSIRVLLVDTGMGVKQVSIAVMISGSCIGIGWGLYQFRCNFRNLYGFMEIVTAAMLAVEICMRPPGQWSSTSLLAGLLGAIYVTVRGFDNIAEHKKKQKKRREFLIAKYGIVRFLTEKDLGKDDRIDE